MQPWQRAGLLQFTNLRVDRDKYVDYPEVSKTPPIQTASRLNVDGKGGSSGQTWGEMVQM